MCENVVHYISKFYVPSAVGFRSIVAVYEVPALVTLSEYNGITIAVDGYLSSRNRLVEYILLFLLFLTVGYVLLPNIQLAIFENNRFVIVIDILNSRIELPGNSLQTILYQLATVTSCSSRLLATPFSYHNQILSGTGKRNIQQVQIVDDILQMLLKIILFIDSTRH